MQLIAVQTLLKWIEERNSKGMFSIPNQIMIDKIRELGKAAQHRTETIDWDETKNKLPICPRCCKSITYVQSAYDAERILMHLDCVIKSKGIAPAQETVNKFSKIIGDILAEKKGNTHIKDCVKCKGKNLIKIVLSPVTDTGFTVNISKCPSCDYQAMDVEEFFPKYKSSKTKA